MQLEQTSSQKIDRKIKTLIRIPKLPDPYISELLQFANTVT